MEPKKAPTAGYLGSNTMTLNTGTVMAALQMFLDHTHTLGAAPKVTGISAKSSGDSPLIVVTLDGPNPTN